MNYVAITTSAQTTTLSWGNKALTFYLNGMNENENPEEFSEMFDVALSNALDVEPAFDEPSIGKFK